ncbi:MAG: hypothetical protein M3355_09920 [Actinomycetota bacterium]|nr:hypothetical protein [Actinomycetota bacterium]
MEELVECGVQLARMLDHMYLNESTDPDIPRPPEVLRDLVAKTIEKDVGRRKRDVYTATGLLLETRRTIERELFLVDPGAFDDLAPDDSDGPFDGGLDDQLPEDPFLPPGGTRLH